MLCGIRPASNAISLVCLGSDAADLPQIWVVFGHAHSGGWQARDTLPWINTR
jgi:hypothetical protein